MCLRVCGHLHVCVCVCVFVCLIEDDPFPHHHERDGCPSAFGANASPSDQIFFQSFGTWHDEHTKTFFRPTKVCVSTDGGTPLKFKEVQRLFGTRGKIFTASRKISSRHFSNDQNFRACREIFGRLQKSFEPAGKVSTALRKIFVYTETRLEKFRAL